MYPTGQDAVEGACGKLALWSYLKEKRALLRAIAVFGEITLHSGSVCCHPLKDETLADQGRGALEAPQPSLLCSPA